MKNTNLSAMMIFALLLLSASANAYTTNSSNKIFSFAVTSGKNNEMNSSSYKSYVALGDITGALGSSNFQTELGFMGTAFRIDGDLCQADVECAGGFCCSGKCSHSHCQTSQASAPSGESGGGSAFPTPGLPTPSNTYTYVFDSLIANSQTVVNVNREKLPITKIIFSLKENLNAVTLSLSAIESPSHSIEQSLQYFEISSNKISISNIASLKIDFRVNKSLGYIKESIE